MPLQGIRVQFPEFTLGFIYTHPQDPGLDGGVGLELRVGKFASDHCFYNWHFEIKDKCAQIHVCLCAHVYVGMFLWVWFARDAHGSPHLHTPG